MISIRSLLSLFAFLLLVGCAGTNAVTTDFTDEVVEIVTSTTSENERVTRTQISSDSSTVERPAATPKSTSEPLLLEYEITKISESFAEVTEVVENFVADNSLNGAGLIVVDRDHGVRYHNHWGEFSPDRISLIASTSKVVSAGVFGRNLKEI